MHDARGVSDFTGMMSNAMGLHGSAVRENNGKANCFPPVFVLTLKSGVFWVFLLEFCTRPTKKWKLDSTRAVERAFASMPALIK